MDEVSTKSLGTCGRICEGGKPTSNSRRRHRTFTTSMAGFIALALLNETVRVRWDPHLVRLFHHDTLVAVHRRLGPGQFAPRPGASPHATTSTQRAFEPPWLPLDRSAGVGKSHCATAIAIGAIRRGYRALIRSTFDLAQDFAEADATGDRRALVEQLTRVDLLVLEDFGSSVPRPRRISSRSSCGATAKHRP